MQAVLYIFLIREDLNMSNKQHNEFAEHPVKDTNIAQCHCDCCARVSRLEMCEQLSTILKVCTSCDLLTHTALIRRT